MGASRDKAAYKTGDKIKTRRRFLRMLASSPLLAGGGLIYGPLAKMLAADSPDESRAYALLDDLAQGADLISAPEQALDVMDFEPVARKALPPAHFGYLATGVDDDATIRANRDGFSKFQIRSRRLVDVSRIDMSIRLFGAPWETPIILCPVGSQKAFHPEGEVAVARAAKSKGHLQILSTVSSSSGLAASARRRPIFEGLDVSKVNSTYWAGNDWSLIKRLKDTFSMKVLLKGIVAREDAELAVANGVDGIIVSNHGGRAENTLRSTIESLPQVLQGAAGKIPVIVDSGFRRGTDAFKALALGATAMGIGRPYIWGLASFGQPGVEAVLAIMRRELQISMREAGTASVAKITRAYIVNT